MLGDWKFSMEVEGIRTQGSGIGFQLLELG